MRFPVRYAAAVIAIAVVGCEGTPTSLTGSLERDQSSSTSRSSVVGGGQIDLSDIGIGNALFEYSVRGNADGSASGQFRQRFELDGQVVDFTGSATCMAVDPANHRAWVGGVIARNRSTDPDYQDTSLFSPGKDIWFRAVDYRTGQTPSSTPDRSTIFGFIGSAGFQTSAAYCAGRPWAAGDARTHAVLNGSIRIADAGTN